MNSPAWVPWLVVGLAVALAVVSAIAGALWARVRSLPTLRVAQLARELAERQRSLEDLLLRLERGSRPRGVELPSRSGMAPSEVGEPAAPAVVSPLSPALPHEGGGSLKTRGAGLAGDPSPTPTLPHERGVGRIEPSPLVGEGGRVLAAGRGGGVAHPAQVSGRSLPLSGGPSAWGAGEACDPPPTPALLHKGGGNQTEPIRGGDHDSSPAPARRVDAPHATPPGPTLIAVPDLAAAREPAAAAAPAEDLQRRHGAAWELADAGATVGQIAAHLGLPIGHVTLILGLRRPVAGGPAGR
jgi:hypothetical protein